MSTFRIPVAILVCTLLTSWNIISMISVHSFIITTATSKSSSITRSCRSQGTNTNTTTTTTTTTNNNNNNNIIFVKSKKSLTSTSTIMSTTTTTTTTTSTRRFLSFHDNKEENYVSAAANDDDTVTTGQQQQEEDLELSLQQSNITNDDNDNDDNDTFHQGNTRFSKFAPDPNLDTADFRYQLRENMKADLERRRRQDPNRGNQPAKNYLDSL